jgi:hypothetical protein
LIVFIFLDDNPVECAEVQANCPEVLTLQLPEDPGLIPQFLDHCWAFDHLKLTAEDRRRAELYQQNRVREKLRAEAPTLDEFLASLELKIQIEPISATHWPRVAQLTQRTNQFNFTTHRRTEAELGQWLASADGLIVTVSDRFGDYGLVGAILYQVTAKAVVVDNLLLSCRVLGRGVEHRMLARLGEIAREREVPWVDAHFVPTAKNKPALDFLNKLAVAFKQPLNGGSVFRLPADVAAKATRHSSSAQTLAGPMAEAPGYPGPLLANVGHKFARCREIALEANNPTRIHEEIRKGALVRQRGQLDYVAPKTDLQRQLCALWQENCFTLNRSACKTIFSKWCGHSLLAVRLFVEIEKIRWPQVPVGDPVSDAHDRAIIPRAHASGGRRFLTGANRRPGNQAAVVPCAWSWWGCSVGLR